MSTLAAADRGASVDGMTTYELGDSNPDPLQALVFVRLRDPSPIRFERFLDGAAGIVAAWHVVGDIDLAVQVACSDLAELDQLLTGMRIEGGAAGTSTQLLVRRVSPAPAPDRQCPAASWSPSAAGLTFQTPEPAAPRTRSLRRSAR